MVRGRLNHPVHPMATILIVDDDKMQRTISRRALEKVPGYVLEEACDGTEALARLLNSKLALPDLVLLDHYMPNMDGTETLRRIRESFPTLPVIIVTSNNELEEAVTFMRNGASDFISKPFNPQRLSISVEQHLKLQVLSNEVARLNRREKGQGQFSDLIGHDSGLAACIAIGRKAAASEISVLIQGESGTGKELFARAIHGESARAGKAFVAINCGAIPENLVESTLFGHERGSFTGAIARELGKFREADGGTLLLDEVGELKPEMQTRLLRVLQQKEVQPVGAGKAVPVNVRIISATHRDLADDVAHGRFREDLYYRLNVLPVTLPRLADRPQDIPMIAEHLVKRICAAERRMPLPLDESALKWLSQQAWQGNVRELENLLYRAVVLADKPALGAEDFRALASQAPAARPSVSHAHYVALMDAEGNPRPLDDIENDAIEAAMLRCNNNVAEAARALNMGQSTLYKKLSARNAA